MKVESVLARIVPVLDKARIPYMLTGSVASSVYGMQRSTQDLDIVIAPTLTQLRQMVSEFQALDFYSDEIQATAALANRSQFNIMDNASEWKVDFIFAEETEYGRTALARREPVALGAVMVQIARVEDVVIAKLRWAKKGGSARQIEDVVGIYRIRRNELDITYIEQWVRNLGLEQQWDSVRANH